MLAKRMIQEPWKGATFSQRVWKNQDKLFNELNTNVKRGILTGKPVAQMAMELSKEMDSGLYESSRLLRTETMHHLNVVNLASMKEERIEKVQEVVTLDERTSEQCSPHNGLIWDIDKAPDLPRHPNCRCVLVPYIDIDKEVKRLDKREKESLDKIEKRKKKEQEILNRDTRKSYNEDTEFIDRIKSAETIKEANKIAEEMGFTADYAGIDIRAANDWNLGLYNAKRDFPEVAEQIHFVGAAQKRNSLYKKEFKKHVTDHTYNDEKGIYNIYLKAGYTEDEAKKERDKAINSIVRREMKGLKIEANVVAQSFSLSPDTNISDKMNAIRNKYVGISLNNKKFDDYDKFIKSQKEYEKRKWHPVGCHNVKSMFDHEFGHQIDAYLGLSENEKIIKLWESQTKESLKDGLSEYAYWNGINKKHEDPGEMIAEAWSEYQNNENPREIAKVIGEEIIKLWKKKS